MPKVQFITGGRDMPLMGARRRRRKPRPASGQPAKVAAFLAGDDALDDERSGLDPDRRVDRSDKPKRFARIFRPGYIGEHEAWYHREGKLWCVGLVGGQGYGEGDRAMVHMKGGRLREVVLDSRIKIEGDLELWTIR